MVIRFAWRQKGLPPLLTHMHDVERLLARLTR
jgi:hypothetical protein